LVTQFEFRLIHGHAPPGQLDADSLLRIVKALKQTALEVARCQVDSSRRGRPSHDVDRLAQLNITMSEGSTVLTAERAHPHQTLGFDLEDEETFDARMGELMIGVANNHRPDWSNDAVARGAWSLACALSSAAPVVEVRAADRGETFSCANLNERTWVAAPHGRPAEDVALIGLLEAVDLHSKRFRIRDSVGLAVALPNVEAAEQVAGLIGREVLVRGEPVYGDADLITELHNAEVEIAPELDKTWLSAESVPLTEILDRASVPPPGPISDLTDDEFGAFMEALGL
jgi:hypothetical protein